MPASSTDLAGVPLFASLSAAELAEAAVWFEVRDVGPGVRLVGEGATGASFFVVIEGALDVSLGGGVIASLGPGDFFGEIALLGAGRRTATVTTAAPTRVLVTFGEEFRRLQARHPALAATVEAAMRERLDRAQG